MKTYTNIKTGNRFPEHGCDSWFLFETKTKWVNGELITTPKNTYFIRFPRNECTNGWKKFNPKQWKIEEIPDFKGHCPKLLEDPALAKEWIEYAKKWGTLVAQEYLPCCDATKPDWAEDFMNPPANLPSWEDRQWFESVFGDDPLIYNQPLLGLFTHRYTFDILAFDRKLQNHYKEYVEGMSMAQFMDKKFGVGTANRFKEIFLKSS